VEVKDFISGFGERVLGSENPLPPPASPEDKEFLKKYKVLRADKKRLTEQCVLLSLLGDIKERGRNRKYPNLILLDGDQPGDIVSSLLTSRYSSVLSTLTSIQKSLLVPRLRIFHRIYPEDGGIPQEIELRFDDHITKKTIEDILASHEGRGGGVGIKQLVLTNSGKDTAEAAIWNAVLRIYAQSLDELVNTQESEGASTKLINLINYTGKMTSGSFDPLNFEIKVEIGWEDPEDKADIFGSDLIQAIRKAKATYLFILKKHHMMFGEDGSVELAIEYVASADITGYSSIANILSLEETEVDDSDGPGKRLTLKTATESLEEAKKEREKLSSLTVEDAQKRREEIERIIEEREKRVLKFRAEIYSNFIREMLGNNRIYSLSLDKGKFQKWFVEKSEKANEIREGKSDVPTLSSGDFKITEASSGLKTSIESALLSSDKKSKGVSEKSVLDVPSDPGQKNIKINYIYAGDIISTAIQFAYQQKLPNNHFFVLGPVAFSNPFNPSNPYDYINIADIPITVNQFNVWWTNTVVKGEKITYSLKKFLEDVMSGLIFPALRQSCEDVSFDKAFVQMLISSIESSLLGEDIERLSEKNVSVVKEEGVRIDFSTSTDITRSLKEGNEDLEHKDPSKLATYHMVFGFVPGITRLTQKEEEDAKSGVAWIRWGADRGLVKNITFSVVEDNNQQDLAISRGLDKISSPLDALRRIYKAEIRMVGNPFFQPGCLIYIDPSSLVFKASNSKIPISLGIAGYYQVLSTESRIEPGAYETVLSAINVGGLISGR
jgi:hypothetical protein